MDFTKPPNKNVVLIVVGVVVVVWLLVWLLGPKPDSIQPSAPLDAMLTTMLQAEKPEKKEQETSMEDSVPEAWGRDPFADSQLAKLDEREKQPDKATRPQTEALSDRPQYKVSTILVTEANRLAVIDDKVYAVGDQIGGETIVRITLEHVVLTDGSTERMLKVPGPQTQVKVETTGRK
jgi:hypothetical protein